MQCKLDHNDPDGIPLFCCATCNAEARAKAAAEFVAKPVQDPIEVRQAKLKADQRAAAEAKRKASLAKLKDAHPFESWNPKTKSWERDQAKIDAHHAAMEATQ